MQTREIATRIRERRSQARGLARKTRDRAGSAREPGRKTRECRRRSEQTRLAAKRSFCPAARRFRLAPFINFVIYRRNAGRKFLSMCSENRQVSADLGSQYLL
jgi:hypothetical protein